METWIQNCLYWAWWTLPTHWKSSYQKNTVMQCQKCSTWTTRQILEHWHTIQQSWETYQPPCKFTHYHTQWQKMNTFTYVPSHLWMTCAHLLASIFTWLYLSVPQPQERAGNQYDWNVLKAYPTCYSWIITAHISLGNLERQWKSFTWQMDRTWQLLKSLCQWTSTPTHLISKLQAELNNLDNICTSYRPTS